MRRFRRESVFKRVESESTDRLRSYLNMEYSFLESFQTGISLDLYKVIKGIQEVQDLWWVSKFFLRNC